VGLDGLWLSQHLAERERGGKNLDENHAHAITHQPNCPRREATSEATGPIVQLSWFVGGLTSNFR
jgi:hypothetical protein